VTLPFLLLLLDYWPLARVQPTAARPLLKVWRPLIIEKIPLFVLSALIGVATLLTQENYMATVVEFPLSTRLGYAAVSYIVYLGQMFYPAGLVVLYHFPERGLPLLVIVPALALLVGISAGALALRRRHPYLLVGWLWYLGMLVPMLGLVHVGSVARADRFTYLSQIGLYIMLAWTAKDLAACWRPGRWIMGAGALSAVIVLMASAWKQTSFWRNSESLWTHTLTCTPGNTTVYNDLGKALFQKGQVDEAILEYQKALVISPEDAGTYVNLGGALIQKGKVNEAITNFQKALSIRPDFAEAHNNLGNALLQKGNVAGAIAQLEKALQRKPDYAEAHYNLGNALFLQGTTDKAIVQYQEALKILPDFAEAHYYLGNVLLRKGQLDEAILQFQKALAIWPEDAGTYNNLGRALIQKGNVNEAIANFQKALSIRPDFAEAHNNLGSALLQKGQLDEAILQFQKALAIQPDNAEVQNNLGDVLLQKGQLNEAIIHLQKALVIQPDYAQAHYNLGNVLFLQGTTDEAIVQYQEALTSWPDYAEAHYNLGKVLFQEGQWDEAILHLQKALAIQPGFLDAQSALVHIAQILATSPDPSVRNGTKAVDLAEQIDRLSGGGNPVMAGTLAAAYAEAGRFPEAITTAQRAVRLAKSQDNPAQVAALEAQLKLYQDGSPLRDTVMPH